MRSACPNRKANVVNNAKLNKMTNSAFEYPLNLSSEEVFDEMSVLVDVC